jgi:ech hydrogenase subunit E
MNTDEGGEQKPCFRYPDQENQKNEITIYLTLFQQTTGADQMSEVTIGPFHPYLLEPFKLDLDVQDGIIREAKVESGFVHRGIEALMQKGIYRQNLFVSERVCGICSVVHGAVYSRTVESIFGIKISARAKYLRTVVLELERLRSHYLNLGLIFHAVDFGEGFAYALEQREPVMDLLELIGGNRVSPSISTIGGARWDLTEEAAGKLLETLPKLEESSNQVLAYLDEKPVVEGTGNVGTLEKEEALGFGAVGPVARGSGWNRDIRSNEPYEAYQELGFRPVVEEGCDVLARSVVRAKENLESIRLIQKAVEELPEGDIKVDISEPIPGEYLGRIEAPRGELVYFINSDGTNIPARVKIRAPSYNNLRALCEMLKNEKETVVRQIIESMDPCLSCTDR